MFKMLDVVRQKQDRPADGLKAGDVGTVVDVLQVPTPAVLVEFCDPEGETLAELVLGLEDVEQP